MRHFFIVVAIATSVNGARAGDLGRAAFGNKLQSLTNQTTRASIKSGKGSADNSLASKSASLHSSGVIAAHNGNTGISGIGLPSQFGNRVVAAPNGNTGISGIGLPQSLKNTNVISAPNGNTGITGAGVPAGTAFKHAGGGGANISPAALKPQKTMSFGLSDLAGAAINPIGTLGNAAGDALEAIENVGNHRRIPDDPPADGPVFQGSIQATAIPPGSLKDKAIGSLHPGDVAGASSRVAAGLSKSSSLGNLATPIGNGIPSSPSGVVNKSPDAGNSGGAGNNDPGNGNNGSHTGNKPGNQSHDLGSHRISRHTPPVGMPGPSAGGVLGSQIPVIVGNVLSSIGEAMPVNEQAAYLESAAPVAEAPAQMQDRSAAVDLVLEDVQYVEPATKLVGPAYRVKFRNQSSQSVGAMAVAIFAGIDRKLTDDAPRTMIQVIGMEPGESKEVTLRLPAAAMKLSAPDAAQPSGFTHLFVAVDVTNAIAELDETNNLAVIERSALETLAQ